MEPPPGVISAPDSAPGPAPQEHRAATLRSTWLRCASSLSSSSPILLSSLAVRAKLLELLPGQCPIHKSQRLSKDQRGQVVALLKTVRLLFWPEIFVHSRVPCARCNGRIRIFRQLPARPFNLIVLLGSAWRFLHFVDIGQELPLKGLVGLSKLYHVIVLLRLQAFG